MNYGSKSILTKELCRSGDLKEHLATVYRLIGSSHANHSKLMGEISKTEEDLRIVTFIGTVGEINSYMNSTKIT